MLPTFNVPPSTVMSAAMVLTPPSDSSTCMAPCYMSASCSLLLGGVRVQGQHRSPWQGAGRAKKIRSMSVAANERWTCANVAPLQQQLSSRAG